MSAAGRYGRAMPTPSTSQPAPGMARAALVCGLAGLPLFFLLVPSAVAVVLGWIAASHARRTPPPHDGLAAARIGWVLGVVGVVLFAVLVVVLVWG